MVTVNTQLHSVFSSLDFKYFLDVPRCNCCFGSAVDKTTGKIHCFLIFNENGRIYKRNAINDTWLELDKEAYHQIKEVLNGALNDKTIPSYSSQRRIDV